MPAPPFGATENAFPGMASVWSRYSDQVSVWGTPVAASVAELMVGAAVSTRKDWVAENEEPAAEESRSVEHTSELQPLDEAISRGTAAETLAPTARLVLLESKVPSELEQLLVEQTSKVTLPV